MAPRKTATVPAEAPAETEAQPTTASLPIVFDIPAERFLTETRRRSPRATPHRFQPIIQASKNEAKPKGIVLHKDAEGALVDSEGEKVSAVISGLRTAAAQLGIEVKTYDKSDAEPPYVAVVAVTDETAALVKPFQSKKAKAEDEFAGDSAE